MCVCVCVCTHPHQGLTGFNELVQTAFLRFWTSLFRKYRRFFRYLRVVPQPVVIFNKAAFAVSRPSAEVRTHHACFGDVECACCVRCVCSM